MRQHPKFKLSTQKWEQAKDTKIAKSKKKVSSVGTSMTKLRKKPSFTPSSITQKVYKTPNKLRSKGNTKSTLNNPEIDPKTSYGQAIVRETDTNEEETDHFNAIINDSDKGGSINLQDRRNSPMIISNAALKQKTTSLLGRISRPALPGEKSAINAHSLPFSNEYRDLKSYGGSLVSLDGKVEKRPSNEIYT